MVSRGTVVEFKDETAGLGNFAGIQEYGLTPPFKTG